MITIDKKNKTSLPAMFLLVLLIADLCTNSVAQTAVASFYTGVTESGEECVCEALNQAPQAAVSTDILISAVECNPDDQAACQANCAGIHGADKYLSDKCCTYVGQLASILAFEEDSKWIPRLEEFNKCTGARVRLEYLADGEDGMADALRNDLGDDLSHEQGLAAGQGIFDAYIVQAPWLWPVIEGLENLSPHIREHADTVKFLDINPASRSAVSYNGTVRALPLDTDYVALGWRQDVFHKYQIPAEMSPPRTIQDLATIAEQLHGLDFNDDGNGDWGVCLTPQVNYFYAILAPLMQSSLKDPDTGTLTGQNLFFDPDTFEPLIRQPAFKTAMELYYKIIRHSNCGEQLAAGEKCDRKTAFPTGRCAMVLSMPGTLTDMLIPGGEYAPLPRKDEATGEVLWDVNNMTLGEGGSYWGRRAPFPGSTVVQKWDKEAGYPLVECAKDSTHCPLADVNGINYAPFFAEGGEAYAINGRQSKPAAKRVMWDLFTWLSELPETALPLSGQYRKSHLNEAHRKELTDKAGWPDQMVDDIFSLLGQYFKSEEEGGNPVQDLLMLGFPEYMDALDEEMHDKFLGVKPDSEGGVFNRNDPFQSIDPYLDTENYNKAFSVFIESLEAKYEVISDSISGGRMGQLQRWRSSLDLPWLTDQDICFAVLSSNRTEAFRGLQCSPLVSFDALCQTNPQAVANFDADLCASLVPNSVNLAVLIPSIVIPLIVLAVVGAYCYGEWMKKKAEVHWQINPEELKFDDPPDIIGQGRFGDVFLAQYRGTAVAVKTMIPAKLNKPRLNKGVRDDELGEESTTPDMGVSTSFSPGLSSMKSYIFGSKAFSLGLSSVSSKGQLRKDQFVEEIRMLVKLQEHRNIVCVMGAVVVGTREPKLVLEYMERGSLRDLLQSDAPIGGQLLRSILADVTQGVMFLHNANPPVIHSDLKSSNILIDERYRAKVSDFGWGAAGTPYWTAPEVLRRETVYTTASDVYALGITMYEMYARCFPYEHEDPVDVLKKVQDPKVNKRPPCPSTMGPTVANMMRDCLVANPYERPILNELSARINRLALDEIEYQTALKGPAMLFPEHVAKALSQGHRVEPQTHEMVTACYCEIMGFGALSSELAPTAVTSLLQKLNDCFDGLADQHQVFLVDMGGGAWVGATNCIQHQPNDHTSRIARFAVDAVKAVAAMLVDEDNLEHGFVPIQFAFVSGPVQGKVVGTRTPKYSLFGPTIEAASFLARQKSEPGRIICTEVEQAVLEKQVPEVSTEVKARVFVTGMGAQTLFWVSSPKPESAV